MVSLPPLADFDPVQVPPDAVQDVGAPVVVQARLVLIGAVPVVGEADKATVGATPWTMIGILTEVPPLEEPMHCPSTPPWSHISAKTVSV